MTSDNAFRGNIPDQKFLPAGTGHLIANRTCNACLVSGRPVTGGGKQHVRWAGKKLWVGACCLKVVPA